MSPRRSATAPSRRLLGLMTAGLFVAVLPVLVHPGLWVVVVGGWAGVAAAVLLDLVAVWRASPALEVSAPQEVGVGDAAELSLRLRLGGGSALRGLLRAETRGPLEPGEDLEALLPAGTSDHRLLLNTHRRGTGEADAVWCRLEGPLGLVLRVDRVAVDLQVAVTPNLRRVRSLALEQARRLPQLFGGTRLSSRLGEAGEFDTLETYQPGMDIRSIDWKAAARHQALMVRRFRLERNQRVVACLDTGRLMGDPIDGLQRLDHGVHTLLLAGHAAVRAGDLFGLHAYGSQPHVHVPPAGGMRHLKRLARACARLHCEDAETNHVHGLRDLLVRLRRRSLVIIFTDFVDSITAELMLETIGYLVQRHFVMFVALDDAVIEAPLRLQPREPDDLSRAVVAGGLRQDRLRVLRRLEHVGANVVHGPPGRLAFELINRYLRIKKRGLIG